MLSVVAHREVEYMVEYVDDVYPLVPQDRAVAKPIDRFHKRTFMISREWTLIHAYFPFFPFLGLAAHRRTSLRSRVPPCGCGVAP